MFWHATHLGCVVFGLQLEAIGTSYQQTAGHFNIAPILDVAFQSCTYLGRVIIETSLEVTCTLHVDDNGSVHRGAGAALTGAACKTDEQDGWMAASG